MKADQTNDTIYFVSLNYAVQQGQFDGVTSVSDLRSHGDFGLGTEEKLKTELVIIDGEFYGIDAEGKASKLHNNSRIAYAALKRFEADQNVSLDQVTDLKDLEQQLADIIHSNSFAAIRLEATFNTIQFRSFNPQQKPYKRVDDVPEIKFNRQSIKGTIVGYYTPESALVVNSPVFHFHFIDHARKTGGHLLECSFENASLQIDYAKKLEVLLPDTTTTDQVELNKPMKSKG